jgi:hypothetical protein
MVTKITVPTDITEEQAIAVFRHFNENTGLFLHEHLLTEDSKCEKYEHTYIFGDEIICNAVINAMLENNVPVLGKEDFTNSLVEIVNSNRIQEFKKSLNEDYEETFDMLFDEFINGNVTKDMVLDKINALGMKSLQEHDYKILKS